jgi:hypothetical protein
MKYAGCLSHRLFNDAFSSVHVPDSNLERRPTIMTLIFLGFL